MIHIKFEWEIKKLTPTEYAVVFGQSAAIVATCTTYEEAVLVVGEMELTFRRLRGLIFPERV